ncbi:MAG: alpha/beta fold hydrolase [Candidatus Saccharibacteria bacterium]
MNRVITETPKRVSKTGVVLIAGAGLGTWVWDDMVTALETPSLAISFPDAASKKSMSLEDYTKTALEQVKAWQGVDRYVIVGHSIGAIIALQLADLLKDRVAGLIAISAVIPKNGGSFFSGQPFPQKVIIPLLTRLAGTRPPDSAIKKSYCNDLSAAQTAEVLRRFQPESVALYGDKSVVAVPDIPRLYIMLSRDQNLSPTSQTTMAINLKAGTVTLETGHLPMVSKPTELAHVFEDFISHIQ